MTSQENITPADTVSMSGGRAPHSGIIVLALNREVLYINKVGRDLLLRWNGKDKGSVADGLLPKALAALVDEIIASRLWPVEDRGWRRFAEKRLVPAPGQSLFVQAFAQSQQPHVPRPVIVLTMDSAENRG